MKLAVTTSSLEGYGLNRIFKFIKETGFDGIELVLSKKDFDTQNAQYVNELCKQYNLPILAIQALEKSKPKQIQEAVDLAITIGCRVIIVKPPKIFDFKYSQWLKEEVPKIREKESISIALENAPDETILGFIPAHAMNSMNDLKNFRHACLNTAFVASKKDNIIDMLLKMKKYLVHVHLTNMRKNNTGALPQNGSLPIESFLSKLKQEDYKGCVSIDVNPKYLHVSQDNEMQKLLIEAKEFCLKYM